MTVGELLQVLENVDRSRIVVLSSDPEGNHYAPAGGWGLRVYASEGVWENEVYPDDSDEEGITAFVLWPEF